MVRNVRFVPSVLMCVLLSAMMVTAGCASGGGRVAPGETAADEMTRTRVEVARTRPVVEDAMERLDTLLTTTSGELREPHDDFRVAVRDVTAHERRMTRQVDRMRGQRDRFLRSWRSDSARLESEDLRSRADRRAVEVEQRYARIEDLLRQFSESFTDLAGKFRDLDRFLANDLTADGLASVRTMRGPLRGDAADALSAMEALLSEMDRLAGDLSPVVGTPAPASNDEES